MARNIEREVEALLAAESAADAVWRDLVVLLANTNTFPGLKRSPASSPTVMATDSGATLRPRLARFSLGKRARTYEKDHLVQRGGM